MRRSANAFSTEPLRSCSEDKSVCFRPAALRALAGLVLGIIFTPVGMLLGCFLGAFLAELYWGEKSGPEALKASFGAFLGVVTGTGVKLIATCVMMWFIVLHA